MLVDPFEEFVFVSHILFDPGHVGLELLGVVWLVVFCFGGFFGLGSCVFLRFLGFSFNSEILKLSEQLRGSQVREKWQDTQELGRIGLHRIRWIGSHTSLFSIANLSANFLISWVI